VLDAAGNSGYSSGVTGRSASILSTTLLVVLALAIFAVLVVLGIIVAVGWL
jgi:hypothetical protein